MIDISISSLKKYFCTEEGEQKILYKESLNILTYIIKMLLQQLNPSMQSYIYRNV